jgi:hypothetical protein
MKEADALAHALEILHVILNQATAISGGSVIYNLLSAQIQGGLSVGVDLSAMLVRMPACLRTWLCLYHLDLCRDSLIEPNIQG